MQLYAALGVSLMQTKGAAPDTSAAWTTALEIAERLDDTEYQLRALWGLWTSASAAASSARRWRWLNASRSGWPAPPIRPICSSASE